VAQSNSDDEDRDDKPGREPPELIDGRVIPASKMKLFGMFLACLFFFVVCGYAFYERWMLDEGEGVLPFRLTWWGSILCGVGFLIGVGGMIAFPIELLCPKQLVLGDDAFQLVRQWRSGPAVELHIPYANIKEVIYEKHDDTWQLGIDLHDTEDADTYAKGPNDLKQLKKKGRDYVLDGGYTMSQKEIADILDKRQRKALRRRDAEEREEEE
jgi:hypothetical protein